MNWTMSVPYGRSQEELGKKHGLCDDYKQGDSAVATSVGPPSSNSKIPLMKDKSSNEPNRIGFLNQCKLELSAEVIRWKEESHKQRKEKEVCEQKISMLQSVLEKLNKRNEELEASLLSSNQECEKLKMHSLAINEENRVLHRKLSKTCSKYYSYPWSEFGTSPVFPFLNGNAHQLPKTEVGVKRSWEEVSEKLIEQMKLEMKELQELGQKLAINELPSNVGDRLASCSFKSNQVCLEQSADGNDVENSIIDLTCDLETLKQCLRNQHQKLSMLLNKTSSDSNNLPHPTDNMAHHTKNSVPGSKVDSAYSLTDWETSDISERKFVRPSDDSFRAYFTQQLSNSKSTEELKRMMNFYLDGNKSFLDDSSVTKQEKAAPICPQMQPKNNHRVDMATPPYQDSHVCSDETLVELVRNNSPITSKDSFSEEERVCPICETVFPRVFSQKEFESHVVAHLEAESASLLDQYEIL